MTRSAAQRAVPPEGNVLKTLGHLVQKDAGAPPVFRMSSAVLDRHQDRVAPDSIKTGNFEKNPILLWNHDDGEPAIGTCRVFREGDEWLMEPSFDELDALSKTVAAKVKAGTLRTCSIRFRFLDFELNAEGGFDYGEVELLEVSIVNIPANPEAYRVKTNTKQKDNTTPPPEAETSAKALEPADLEAIQTAVAAAIAPVLEKLEALESALSGGAATSAEGEAAQVDEEPEDEEEKGDDDAVEMSEEEAEEMKAFFAPKPTKPTPKKK